jgi:hypothetical protein
MFLPLRTVRLIAALTLASSLAIPLAAQSATRVRIVAAVPNPTGSPVPQPTGSVVPEPTGSIVPVPTGSPVPQPTGSIVPMPTSAAGEIVQRAVQALTGGGMSSTAPASYATFIRKTERRTGLIDTIKKDDEDYFDLGPEQFDHPYIVAPVLASGVGNEAFAGRIYPSFVVEFKRVGRRVLWIQQNPNFSAPPDSPAANALAISVTDSVINSTPIAAEDDAGKHVVISAAFFLTDFENVGKDLGGGSGGGGTLVLFGLPRSGFSLDSSRSYLERVKTLPKNDEILASLAFTGPPGQTGAAPDSRGVRIRMHYSIVEPPTTNTYVPRYADDRVGYFVTSQKRFDNDNLTTPMLHYIDRWNFNDGPIVYYLTNEIPAQYKPAIRQALLSWNAAFAKIGIPNAVEVRDQPDDPAWDPDDIRYSTVRWITSDVSPFSAYGPHIADPRTGQIFRVEIVIDGESLRSVKRGYVDRVVPARASALNAAGIPQAAEPELACSSTEDCDTYAEGSALYASVASNMLQARGATPAQVQAFADGWLESVVLHESGHNFGLRHNFAASTLYSYKQLHDKNFTATHGIVGSVMEYTPTNLSPEGEPQGSYFQSKLGPYDYWAIRYGYERFPGVSKPSDESAQLRSIADESTRPEYAYATDEDASGPLAIDPRVSTYDLSNDPLAYDSDQFVLVHQLVAKLDRTYPSVDQSYDQERATFESMLRVYDRAALLAAKYVGGVYTSRNHRGQPGSKAPLAVVPYAQSRRAFALLADNVFSSKAMHFSPNLIAQLGAGHFLDRGTIERPDFPVEDAVGDMQDATMYALFSPDAMSRLANASYYAQPGQRTMQLDDLFGWMQAAVWDDLRPGMTSIDPLHRGLQSRYTRLLIAYSLAPSFIVASIGYPADTVPLAGFELRRLDARLEQALRSPHLDTATRAHLEDVQARVTNAIHASSTRGA